MLNEWTDWGWGGADGYYLFYLFTLPYASVLLPAVEVACEGSKCVLDVGGDSLHKFNDFLIG